MATLFVVVVVFVVAAASGAGGGGAAAAASDIFLFVRRCNWILFGRSTNSSSPSFSFIRFSHFGLSLLSLFFPSPSLSLFI